MRKVVIYGLLCTTVFGLKNHPCGEMKSSAHDLDATDRMIQVGSILDIHVIDHLIISERQYCGYYSFEDHMIMDKLRKRVQSETVVIDFYYNIFRVD